MEKYTRTAKVNLKVLLEGMLEEQHCNEYLNIKAAVIIHNNLVDVASEIRNTVNEIAIANLFLTLNQIFNIAKKDIDKKYDN